jgi:hypothetical protein
MVGSSPSANFPSNRSGSGGFASQVITSKDRPPLAVYDNNPRPEVSAAGEEPVLPHGLWIVGNRSGAECRVLSGSGAIGPG